MAEEKEDKQTCKNCKYFVQHYVKFKTYFHAIDCGHCGNFKISRVKRRSRLFANSCEQWEQADATANADTVQQIKNAVLKMQNRLDDIASLLSFMQPE